MEMKKTEHIVWSDTWFWSNEELEETKLLIKEAENDADLSEDEIFRIMEEQNSCCLDDAKMNLASVEVGEGVCIADIGRWNGRVTGYVLFNGIHSCFSVGADYNKYYIDENKDFRATCVHHDGTNYFLFREWKPNIAETQKENFLDKIYRGNATQEDITRYTRKIGDKIADVYGWE